MKKNNINSLMRILNFRNKEKLIDALAQHHLQNIDKIITKGGELYISDSPVILQGEIK